MASVAHMLPKITFRVLHSRGPVPNWEVVLRVPPGRTSSNWIALAATARSLAQAHCGTGTGTVAQLRRTLSHPSLGPGEEGDWGEGHGKMKKNVLNS